MDAVTLDEVLGDRVAAGVKIDAEGAEALVLAGAKTALAEQRIQLPLKPTSTEGFGPDIFAAPK